MTARRFTRPFAVLALIAASFLVSFGSSSENNANAVIASTEPTMGYTVIDTGQSMCDLYAIDLGSGALTDLPAASSEAACAVDLAVASNGTVYGIAGTQFFNVGSTGPAYDSLGGAELITFAADGTPSGQTLTIGGAPISGISGGSIAIDAAGTIYVIALNETTCDPRLTAPGSFNPSDTYAFNCLFTVNRSNGELTQVGDGFSPNSSIFGLTSCASNMWALMPGLSTTSVGNSPATVGLPWASVNPTTAAITEAGVSTELLGFDCVATGNTVYAMSTGNFGPVANNISPSVPAPAGFGTVDPTSGVFTETVASGTPPGYIYPSAFAVVPVPPEAEPVAPAFTH